MINALKELPAISENRLLAFIAAQGELGFLDDLTPFELRLGDVLYEENVAQRYVYFPTAGVVSMLCLMLDGATAEIALVGRDGLVGFPAIFGDTRTTSRSVVQVAGHEFRIEARELRKLAQSDERVRACC